MRTTALVVVSSCTAFVAGAASAQEPVPSAQQPAARDGDAKPRHRPYRFAAAFAGDAFTYETDRSNLDDSGQAGMLRLQFEAIDKEGRGLGFRYEGLASDDEFFDEAGFVDTRVTSHTLFGHFTKDFGSGDFLLPCRFGLLANLQRLEEQGTPNDVDYLSLGPYVELAPEYRLVRGETFRMSVYGELGFGIGGTSIDVDNDPGGYLSWSVFAGVEAGVRCDFGLLEVGAAYVGRWQSMDQSNPENGLVAFAYHSDFQGLLVSFGVRF